MNYVEPIRDSDKIRELANYLRNYSERNYIMFLIGVNRGLSISDILSVMVRDVKGKDYISLREKKTKKQRIFPITPMLKKELKKYYEEKHEDEFLIKSQKEYKNVKLAGNLINKWLFYCGLRITIVVFKSYLC